MTDAIEINLGRKPEQLSADAGYCSATSSESAIEAVIGHMKSEGHLGRCHLKGHAADAANAILTAAGYNFRPSSPGREGFSS